MEHPAQPRLYAALQRASDPTGKSGWRRGIPVRLLTGRNPGIGARPLHSRAARVGRRDDAADARRLLYGSRRQVRRAWRAFSPVGTVTITITETFIGGFAHGNGDLTSQGQTHPFRLLGTMFGPGGGVSRIEAAGDVYDLYSLADFPGFYTQRSGPAGLNTSRMGDLWLRNYAVVIMHLPGTSSGVVRSLGRDRILIRVKTMSPVP